MLPTFSSGDIVIYRAFRRDLYDLRKGSVVIFRHPMEREKLLLKRVQEVGSNGIDVRGDNSQISIDSRQFGFISYDLLIGIVEVVLTCNNLGIRKLKWMSFESKIDP